MRDMHMDGRRLNCEVHGMLEVYEYQRCALLWVGPLIWLNFCWLMYFGVLCHDL